MTDGTAGWFRDPNDPALARWHDGDRWTEHTLVIAEQTPGTEPPPPVIAPTISGPVFDDTSPYSQWEDTYTEPASSSNRGGGVPTWVKVLGPVAVIAVAAAAFFLLSSGSDDDPADDQTETADSVLSLDDAVDAARRAGLPTEVSDNRAAALIQRICDTAVDPSDTDVLGAQMGSLPATDATDLRQSIAALGIGANRRCADDLDDEPTLIEDLQDAAVVAFSTTTTAVTIGPDGVTDAGTDAGATGGTGGTGGTTKTTKKGSTGSTASTAKPTTTTTLPTVKKGSACSTVGAKAINETAGGSLTCQANCPSRTTPIWTTPNNPACQPPVSIDPNATIPPSSSTTTSSIP